MTPICWARVLRWKSSSSNLLKRLCSLFPDIWFKSACEFMQAAPRGYVQERNVFRFSSEASNRSPQLQFRYGYWWMSSMAIWNKCLRKEKVLVRPERSSVLFFHCKHVMVLMIIGLIFQSGKVAVKLQMTLWAEISVIFTSAEGGQAAKIKVIDRPSSMELISGLAGSTLYWCPTLAFCKIV